MVKRKQLQKIRSHNESGFTIIESLVAMLVVAILMTAIAPVIVLSTATRLQSRRVEQATQAAKTFIDAVRNRSIELPPPLSELDSATEKQPRKVLDKPDDYLINTTNMQPPKIADKDKLYCFNKDGKVLSPTCTSDLFFIQAAQVKVKNSKPNEGYRLAIRIYRKEAFDSPGDLFASDGTSKKQQHTFTGVIDSTNPIASKKSPLIEMTTDIASDTTTFESLCNRLGVASGKNCDN